MGCEIVNYRRPNCRIPPRPAGYEGTSLHTVKTNGLKHASEVLGRNYGTQVPLVILPGDTSGICCVPEGCWALMTSFSEFKGILPPGVSVLAPWTTVSHLVSKATIPLDMPVKDVVTADNVYVQIDAELNIRVTNPADFVYNLGPEKLLELLRAEQDEALRSLARATEARKIYELQGMQLDALVEQMSDRFDDFGIGIVSIIITKVMLNPKLAMTLQERAAYRTKEEHSRMQQEYSMLCQNNKESLAKQSAAATNAQSIVRETGDKHVAKAKRETAEVQNSLNREVAELRAKYSAQVNIVQSKTRVETASIDAQSVEKCREIAAETAKKVRVIQAEKDKILREARAKAALVKRRAQAKKLEMVAEAEKSGADAFEAMRKHQVDLQRASVIANLARNKEFEIVEGCKGMLFKFDEEGGAPIGPNGQSMRKVVCKVDPSA